MSGGAPSREDVARFLARRHGSPVAALEPLSGGFWSSAWAYSAAGRQLVARFGSMREGFDKDRDAMAVASAALPVPPVLEVGEAFGAHYALSVRHHGRFLEEVRPDEAGAAGPMLGRLLAALRAAPTGALAEAGWDPPGGWRGWLLGGLVDDPAHPVHGWRATLAGDPSLDSLFRACEEAVRRLAEACPERRDLVHGDLLHRNVLVSDDASEVTAVFSWKCATLGDFLFDTAWCTFWAPWHPGIEAADPWLRTLASAPAADLADAAVRHHCYELQIGASHLGWYAWTGDGDNLRRAAQHTATVLERGPLPMPPP